MPDKPFFLTTRQQRGAEVSKIIRHKKSLTMTEIRKICGFKQNNAAYKLAYALVVSFPEKYEIKKDGNGKTSPLRIFYKAK